MLSYLKMAASSDKRKWANHYNDKNDEDWPSRNVGWVPHPPDPGFCCEQTIDGGEILFWGGELNVH